MPESHVETRTVKGWRTASKFYRQSPGPGWLLALLAIPLFLAFLGWNELDKSKKDLALTVPSVNPSATLTAPSVGAPDVNAPHISFAPLSILHSGNGFTLTGDLPDAAAKASLLDSLKGALGPGVSLIDNINLKAGVTAPDFSGFGALFKAAVGIPDFSFKLDGDTLTLVGTAPSDDVKAGVEAAAKTAFPNVKIDNQIHVTAPAPRHRHRQLRRQRQHRHQRQPRRRHQHRRWSRRQRRPPPRLPPAHAAICRRISPDC